MPAMKQGAFAPRPGHKGGRKPRQKPGEMNGAERLRAEELDAMLVRGEIAGWRFQPFRLRLAEENCYYAPDFLVTPHEGPLIVEEVKGHQEAAALIRIKVAASIFPFIFVRLTRRTKKEGGGWERHVYKGWSD